MDDLESASKYLADAYVSAKNALVLVDRVSPRLGEEVVDGLTVLEETRERVRNASRALEAA
ncbi:MAG: hypothetical protein ACRDWY_08075 [Actinomycetes bacterium]